MRPFGLKSGRDFLFGAKMPQFYVSLANEKGYHLRNVSYGQAKKMESTGEAVKICRRCGRISKKFCGAHGLSHDIAFQLTAVYRDVDLSPCTLTPSDMKANAGLHGHRIRESVDRKTGEVIRGANFVNEVMEKIEVWPFVGDPKAVRVCPA